MELYNRLLPKDHFKDNPLLSKINDHGVILGSLGTAYRNLDDARKALESYNKALEIAKQIGNKRMVGHLIENLRKLRNQVIQRLSVCGDSNPRTPTGQPISRIFI